MNSVNILLFGATSRLGFSFLRSVTKNDNLHITSYSRPCPDKELSKKNRDVFDTTACSLVSYETDNDLINKVNEQIVSLKGQNNVLVNLSTHDYLNVVEICQQANIPTFAIGSGAVVDWAAKRMKMNGYIEGKVRSEREYTTTIHPGFYLEDTGVDTPFSWSGLHTETYSWLFQKEFDEGLNWGKEKYITSISALINLIKVWTQLITHKDANKRLPLFNRHFAFGTERAYPRWHLRQMSGLPVGKNMEEKYPFGNDYSKEMKQTEDSFGVKAFDKDMFINSCKRAREWTEKNVELLSTYVKLSNL